MAGGLHTLPGEHHRRPISLALVASLNADDAVDGILVQLPLPRAIPTPRGPRRHPPRQRRRRPPPGQRGPAGVGPPGLVPCTPLGCMRLLAESGVTLRGARTPWSSAGATSSASRWRSSFSPSTRPSPSPTRGRATCRRFAASADVLVAAVGRAAMVRGDWVKPGAVVIDVGINRVPRPGSWGGGQDAAPANACFDEARSARAPSRRSPGGRADDHRVPPLEHAPRREGARRPRLGRPAPHGRAGRPRGAPAVFRERIANFLEATVGSSEETARSSEASPGSSEASPGFLRGDPGTPEETGGPPRRPGTLRGDRGLLRGDPGTLRGDRGLLRGARDAGWSAEFAAAD